MIERVQNLKAKEIKEQKKASDDLQKRILALELAVEKLIKKIK